MNQTTCRQPLAKAEQPFDLAAGGDTSYELPLAVPGPAGKCILKAVAKPDDGQTDATISRRWVTVE